MDRRGLRTPLTVGQRIGFLGESTGGLTNSFGRLSAKSLKGVPHALGFAEAGSFCHGFHRTCTSGEHRTCRLKARTLDSLGRCRSGLLSEQTGEWRGPWPWAFDGSGPGSVTQRSPAS